MYRRKLRYWAGEKVYGRRGLPPPLHLQTAGNTCIIILSLASPSPSLNWHLADVVVLACILLTSAQYYLDLYELFGEAVCFIRRLSFVHERMEHILDNGHGLVILTYFLYLASSCKCMFLFFILVTILFHLDMVDNILMVKILKNFLETWSAN